MNGFRPVGKVEQIPGAAEGFLSQEVVESDRMSKREQYETIPQPKFEDIKSALETRLQTAETNLRVADDNVTRYKRDHDGQNGDLTALLDATVKAKQAREAVTNFERGR